MLRQIRAWRVRPVVSEQHDFYAQHWSREALQTWQLEQFNRRWVEIVRSVPYFASLQRQRKIPADFRTWDEFVETMPVMDRATIQQEAGAVASRDRAPDAWRTTGGSTGQPIRIPVWQSELQFATDDIWYGRAWFGVTPEDRLFLIWGHSHLFGRGIRGWINAKNRQVKDRVLGYRRWSAYDLSETGLRKAGDALLGSRASYVISYAVALDRFARVNRDRRSSFRALGLKVAIATAESFPSSESRSLIEDVLGCAVAMEYGCVETGPVAHQRPEGSYCVFWRHFFVEGLATPTSPGAHEIVVTGLFPRCLPLIRYRIGDLIRTDPGDAESAYPASGFGAVIGRCNDYVLVEGGGMVHSETFTHVVKDIPAILGYRVTQDGSGQITLSYTATRELEAEHTARVRARLQHVNPALARVRIVRVAALEGTIAGKARTLVRDTDAGPRAFSLERSSGEGR